MSYFMAGAAAVTAVTAYTSQSSAKNSAIEGMNQTSKAEGNAIVRERLNTTIRNSYQAAFGQMQLSLQKRQLAQQGADIKAATLAAQGNQDVISAATGNIGASVDAVNADIQMKSEQALQMNTDAFENAVDNYNRNLQMMAINTEQSEPQFTQPDYVGPSDGQILGSSLAAGITSFASNYALKKASLGLGSKPTPQLPPTSGGFGTLGSGTFGQSPNIFSMGG